MAIQYRQAPIVGEEGCVHFDGDSYASLPIQGQPFLDEAGFTFVLDCQTDEPVEQYVFCNEEEDGRRFALTIHSGHQRGVLKFEVADPQGATFVATTVARGRFQPMPPDTLAM